MDHPATTCTCAVGFTAQLHDGGARYRVIPIDRRGEISYYFDARCTGCNAEHLGDRGDGVLGVGQQAPGHVEDLLVDHGGAGRRPCRGRGRRPALAGAGDDEFADELGQGGEEVEDEPAAGGPRFS
ncbi:hypothetical protein AB0B21_33385 [Streptomyces rimosus]|uniref:hypothetical protein n=1 Tax=Streptomyces rimosus TaxID=1927 RepID=UPI000519AE9B|nr:hypothetical protein [Streptomyces rimosus]